MGKSGCFRLFAAWLAGSSADGVHCRIEPVAFRPARTVRAQATMRHRQLLRYGLACARSCLPYVIHRSAGPESHGAIRSFRLLGDNLVKSGLIGKKGRCLNPARKAEPAESGLQAGYAFSNVAT